MNEHQKNFQKEFDALCGGSGSLEQEGRAMTTEKIRIRMKHDVRPDIIFLAKPGTILRAGMEYNATANKRGKA